MSADFSGDNQSGVNAEVQAELGLVSVIKSDDRFQHLKRGAQSPFGIILVCDRCAEQRHDFIADEFVDGAIILLHDRHEPIEAGVDQLTYSFRIEFLGERGEPGYICEQDGNQFTFICSGTRLTVRLQLR